MSNDHKALNDDARGLQPAPVMPLAVYTTEQVCDALGIGESKLKQLVKAGRLRPLDFTSRWRFFGEDLIDLCRAAGSSTTDL